VCAISSLTSTFAISSPDEFLLFLVMDCDCQLLIKENDDDDDFDSHLISLLTTPRITPPAHRRGRGRGLTWRIDTNFRR